MSWQGFFKKIRPNDTWAKDEGILGTLVASLGDEGTHETTVAKEFVEDDGKPFEDGEQIEILIRRVKND